MTGIARRAAALALLALAACQTPESRLYTLAVLPPAALAPTTQASTTPAPTTPAPTTLALGALDLPPLVDRPQIVRRIDANRVEALEFDRWAEPLADGLRATLAGDLAVRLPATAVLLVAGALAGDVVTVLSVTILRLDADRAGHVVLDAQWSLSGRDRSVIRHRDTLEIAAASGDPAALVPAISRAVAALADRVAAGVR